MANYGIEIKDVEVVEIGVKDVEIGQVYIKDVQVWAPPVTGGAIITLTIDDDGDASGDHYGLYTVPQLSSDGSGTGAQFDILVDYNSRKNVSFLYTAAIDTGNEGSGYAVGEIVTLDMSTVGGSWTEPQIEVLTVTT